MTLLWKQLRIGMLIISWTYKIPCNRGSRRRMLIILGLHILKRLTCTYFLTFTCILKGKKYYYDVSPLVDLDTSVCLAYKKYTCVLPLASFLSLTFLVFQQIAGSIRLAFKYSKNIPSRFLHLSEKKAQYPQNEPLPYIIDEFMGIWQIHQCVCNQSNYLLQLTEGT